MSSYRCYFLDNEGHIRNYEGIDADTLSEAIDRALAMLKARPWHLNVELWLGASRLYPAGDSNVLPEQTSRS